MTKLATRRSPATLYIAIALCCASLVLSSCRKKHHHLAPVASAPRPHTNEAPVSHPTPPSHKTHAAPPTVPVGYTETGIASWYGIPYHGRPAADGEIYDMETMVAAHRVLPFNTWLRVTNLANGESVNVRVIDRGPFVGGRIIDLSKAAARQIDLLGPGIGKVRLEVISAPTDNPANDYYGVQVGAFSVLANAERAQADFAQRFGSAQIAVRQGRTPLWRVIVGKEHSTEAAQQLAARLTAAGNKNVFVVRLDQSDAISRSAASPTGEPASVR